MTPIDLTPTLTSPGRETWHAIGELVELIGNDEWVVVGGQMVAIHAARFGVMPPRPTTDGDLVVDVRAHGRAAMRRVADGLGTLGFTVRVSPEGVTRYVRGSASVDLLAPEGVGAEVITSPPGHAVQAPGATQAVKRAERTVVQIHGKAITIRTPSLVGAIVAKAAAASIPATRDERLRHQQDLALLLLLATRQPVRALADELTREGSDSFGGRSCSLGR